jgi:endonuclease G
MAPRRKRRPPRRRLRRCRIRLTGPIFGAAEPQFIGAGQVAVPTHFFKVILALTGGDKTMYAAIVPNADPRETPLAEFIVTVEEVERRTGLDFFRALEDSEERRLESTWEALPSFSR